MGAGGSVGGGVLGPQPSDIPGRGTPCSDELNKGLRELVFGGFSQCHECHCRKLLRSNGTRVGPALGKFWMQEGRGVPLPYCNGQKGAVTYPSLRLTLPLALWDS